MCSSLSGCEGFVCTVTPDMSLASLPCDALEVTYGVPIDARTCDPKHAPTCPTLQVLQVSRPSYLVDGLCRALRCCGVANTRKAPIALRGLTALLPGRSWAPPDHRGVPARSPRRLILPACLRMPVVIFSASWTPACACWLSLSSTPPQLHSALPRTETPASTLSKQATYPRYGSA